GGEQADTRHPQPDAQEDTPRQSSHNRHDAYLPVAEPTAALAASVNHAPGRASPACPNDVAQLSAHVKRFSLANFDDGATVRRGKRSSALSAPYHAPCSFP